MKNKDFRFTLVCIQQIIRHDLYFGCNAKILYLNRLKILSIDSSARHGKKHETYL